jgi:hypothetical protein
VSHAFEHGQGFFKFPDFCSQFCNYHVSIHAGNNRLTLDLM